MSAEFSGIVALQANAIIRPPSQLFASRNISCASLTVAQIEAMLGHAAEVAAATSSTSLQTLGGAQINGSGVLLFGAVYADTADMAVVNVTIDGTLVCNVTTGVNGMRVFAGNVGAIDTTNQRCVPSFEAIPFRTSLLVQYRTVSGFANGAGCAIKYRLAN